jgi:hypothetical protein
MRIAIGLSVLDCVLLLSSCSQESTGYINNNLITAPDSLWSFALTGADPDFGCALEQTSDGGFLIAGQSSVFRLNMAKVSAGGAHEWTSIPLGDWDSGANDVHLTADGGYIVTGGIGSIGGPNDVLLLKTDLFGRTKWMKNFGFDEFDCGYDVEPAPGGYIIAGVTESYGAGGKDAWIIRSDFEGNVLWSLPYGQLYDDEANRIRATADTCFIVAGRQFSPRVDQNNYSLWIFKLSHNGALLWPRTYCTGPELICWGLACTPDGGYIMGGTYGSRIGEPGGNAHLRLVKTDSQGNEEWIKSYTSGLQLIGGDLEIAEDGGFLITGCVIDVAGGKDLYLMKTDPQGIMVWQTILGGNGDDKGTSVVATSDGACAVGGFLTPLGLEPQFWLIKMASN